SLFTMNVVSFVAVAGAVVELLLVYFLRFAKHVNIAITDYCKEALDYYLPGSTPKPGMHLALILLVVAAVVLALVGVILTYAVKGKAAPEESYDWDEPDRNSDTGIVNINAGGNAGGSVGSGTENEVVATLVQMNTGKVFMLKNNTEMVLGKGSAADIIIPNPIISRTHAKIICSRGVCTLQDLGSKNGTFVGDDKIPAGSSVVLNSGAYITLGNEIFEFNA
ncbi:MAG: FHA domain-containing protein, partial [Faecalibacterium prausnitzii]|nr:FHA domain-containing protein [Faecalibacterium prausnitzii]